jgi:hypothetical protein
MPSSAPADRGPDADALRYRRRRTLEAAALDLLAVLVFALGGRATHGEGSLLVGTLGTAAPFLAGALVGWGGVVLARFDPWSVRAGLLVYADTVAIGMVLRNLVAGEGTPISFIVTAAAVLALLMLGWRLIAARSTGRRT